MWNVDVNIKEKDPGSNEKRNVVVRVSGETPSLAVDYAIVLASTLMGVGLEAAVGRVWR